MRALTQVLQANRQMLPCGMHPKAVISVAEMLALASSRSRNLQHGTERDYTIGLRVVTADGRVIRTCGRVVKNVAGYDLSKLFIG